MPDGEGPTPWSVYPWHTDECVITCSPYSVVKEMRPVLLDLARRHGLTCFDPQSGTVYFPRNANGMTLRLYEDVLVHGPTSDDVRWALERLGPDTWFAILEDDEGAFVQTATSAGPVVLDGRFAVEYRDGDQYQAVVDDIAHVVSVFERFLAGDPSWREELDFAPLQL
jgi:hypothetical protein